MTEQRQTPIPVNKMVPPFGFSPGADAEILTPKEVFAILRRHVWLLISMIILGFIVGAVTWFLLLKFNPKYTATTFIKVLPPVEKDPMTIGGTVVNKDIQYGHRQSVASLIKQQSTLQNLIDSDKIQQTKWFERFGDSKAIRIQKAYGDLDENFGAVAHRDADFVTISMTCGNKQEASLIVNEMLDLFLYSQRDTKQAEVAAKLKTLRNQLVNVQRDLRLSEDTLNRIRADSGFTDLEEHRFESTTTKRLNELESEYNQLLLDIQQLQASIGTLESQAVGPITPQVADQVERDPTMIMLLQRTALLRMDLAGALTRFGEKHRRVQQIQELLSKTEREKEARKIEIAEQTRQANLRNAEDRLVVLQGRLGASVQMRNEAVTRKRLYDLARVQYDQNMQIRDERQKMLDNYKAQIEKRTTLHDDPESPKVQFAGYAPEPMQISSPLWYIYFLGGTILGFVSGIMFTFLIELLNDLVRTPRDVARFLHIPLLGVIPDANEDKQVHDIDLCNVIQLAPYSVISESYRRFRTNLKLSKSAQSSKVLLVTSGAAGDGKTSVAVNLATAFAVEMKKVLLVDANFWKPSLNKIFSGHKVNDEETAEKPALGLSELLMGRCSLSETLRPTELEGLDIMDSGNLPPNPAELLGSSRMEQLIKQLHQENYDHIILDGPPVLLVSATNMLARFVDGTILVFNADNTKRGAAVRTIRELKLVDANIVGCVLFAVKALKGGYFHEQFRSLQEYRKLQLAHSV